MTLKKFNYDAQAFFIFIFTYVFTDFLADLIHYMYDVQSAYTSKMGNAHIT